MLQRLLATLLSTLALHQQQRHKDQKKNSTDHSRMATKLVLGVVLAVGLYQFWLKNVLFGPRPVSVKVLDTTFPNAKLPVKASQIHSLWQDDSFECIGWQQLYSCQQAKHRKPAVGLGASRSKSSNSNHQDAPAADDDATPTGKYPLKSCKHEIGKDMAGFCLVRNRTSGAMLKLMATSCKSMRNKYTFTCDMAKEFSEFPLRALHYEHSPVAPSLSLSLARIAQHHTKPRQPKPLNNNDEQILDSSNYQGRPAIPERTMDPTQHRSSSNGIAMVVYGRVLASAYASIRLLRYHGCDLPIELWYRPDEMVIDNPVIHLLLAKYNVRIKPIFDPRAKGYFVKVFALYYSEYDNVLLLDCDNLPAKDPSYLFQEPAFLQQGAIFWPDFWQPANSIFELTRHSLVWEFLGMEFVDMFEQESGQVLVNRLTCKPALDKLMFLALHGGQLLEKMSLLWGDKDLFRLAWLNASVPFHLVQFPPAVGGLILTDQAGPQRDVFCGLAMVQHDVQGEIVFLHRNSVKLDGSLQQPYVMTHLQQFAMDANPQTEYRVVEKRTQWMGKDRYCYVISTETSRNGNPATTLTPMSETPYAELEQLAIEFSIEAHTLMTKATQKTWRMGYLQMALLALIAYAFVVLFLARWPTGKSLRDRLPSRFNSVIDGSQAPSLTLSSTTVRRKRSDAGR